MRTATLDLNSRGSFVDDLNSKPGIVMCRDALLHRSHEIQPAFFDSEIKRTFCSFLFLLFFFSMGVCGVWHLAGPRRGGVPDLALLRKKNIFLNFFLLAPITGLGPGRGQILKTSAYQVIKIFESNLGIEHLTFGN